MKTCVIVPIKRIKKELEFKEKELGGDIEERMTEIKWQSHDEIMSINMKDRAADITHHFDNELARLSDSS